MPTASSAAWSVTGKKDKKMKFSSLLLPLMVTAYYAPDEPLRTGKPLGTRA